MMKLLVAILCYRVPELTIDCLRSLEDEIVRMPGTKVAVCENGTGGDAADQIRAAVTAHGWVDWVHLTVVYPNRGFTGGNNTLIRDAFASAHPPEYVLLLNADRDRFRALGPMASGCPAWSRGMPHGVGLRREHDPAPGNARRDRPARRRAIHVF
jgi:GT2 family glycosyltransferase